MAEPRHAAFAEVDVELHFTLRLTDGGEATMSRRRTHMLPATLVEEDASASGEDRHLAILDPRHAENGMELAAQAVQLAARAASAAEDAAEEAVSPAET